MNWLATLVLNFLCNKVYGLISDLIKGLVARFRKNKEIKDTVKKTIDTHDQRDLEKLIGNQHAGEVSGEPGAVVQQEPPPPNVET